MCVGNIGIHAKKQERFHTNRDKKADNRNCSWAQIVNLTKTTMFQL